MADQGTSKRKRTTAQSEIGKLLQRATVEDLFQNRRQHVLTLDHNLSLRDALDELAKHHVLSAPVVLAPSLEDHDEETYMGIVDVNCILKGLFQSVQAKRQSLPEDSSFDEVVKFAKDTWEEFSQRKVITLLGHDVELAFKPATHSSVKDVIEECFLHKGGGAVPGFETVHRVGIFNERGRITRIVSQSDVVKFLASHLDKLGELSNKTLTELGLLHHVVTSPSKLPAIEAFHTMLATGVSSVAIVDSDGNFVHSLSASDLRGITHGNVGDLLLPAQEFLTRSKGAGKFLTLGPDDGFAHAIKQIASCGAHRIIIVSADKEPIGIVSLTDIIRIVNAAAN